MVKFEDERAFPVTMVDGRDESMTNLGMTLRDYFAAKAMQSSYGDPREIAVESYKQADEMIAARSDPPETDVTLLNAVRAFIAASGGVSIVSSEAASTFDRMRRIAGRSK